MGIPLLKRHTVPSSAFDAEFFSSGSYDAYEEDTRSWVRPTARRIARFLEDIPQPEILDVGCAQGYLIAELAERGARVRGVEYSNFAIAGALPAVQSAIRRGSALDGRLFRPRSFDAVICFDVLEYLTAEQNVAAARNMARWTRRFIFFTNPYQHSVSGSQRTNPDPLRLTAFTQKEYRAMFARAGIRYRGQFNTGGGDTLVFEK